MICFGKKLPFDYDIEFNATFLSVARQFSIFGKLLRSKDDTYIVVVVATHMHHCSNVRTQLLEPSPSTNGILLLRSIFAFIRTKTSMVHSVAIPVEAFLV